MPAILRRAPVDDACVLAAGVYDIPVRRLLALAILLCSACDLCEVGQSIHQQRCLDGNADSCQWMTEHVVGGACLL